MYILDADPDRVRKVEIVGGKVEAEITNKSIPVTLGGERVEVLVTNDSLSVRLQSGEVVPVYVQGGSVNANLGPGEIDLLARQINQANVVQRQLGFVSE